MLKSPKVRIFEVSAAEAKRPDAPVKRILHINKYEINFFDHSENLFHASARSPGGPRLAWTLDIKGRAMGLLKPAVSGRLRLVG